MRTLDAATLAPAERRTLEPAVAALRGELGDRLVGVWLYGSRARGEAHGEGSDIDVLVIAADGIAEERVRELVKAAADAEGASPFAFSVFAADPLGRGGGGDRVALPARDRAGRDPGGGGRDPGARRRRRA